MAQNQTAGALEAQPEASEADTDMLLEEIGDDELAQLIAEQENDALLHDGLRLEGGRSVSLDEQDPDGSLESDRADEARMDFHLMGWGDDMIDDFDAQ